MESLPAEIARYIELDRNLSTQFRLATRDAVTLGNDLYYWQRFSNFLGSKDPWEADEHDAAAWCAYCANSGLSAATITSSTTHLNFVFERLGKGHFVGCPGKGTRIHSPFRHPIARQTLKGIRILHPALVNSKLPITLEILDELIDAQPDSTVGIRNRAFFALTWAGAMRGNEVVSLQNSQHSQGKGYIVYKHNGLVIVLNQSKANRLRTILEYYGIPKRSSAPRHCPYFLLQEWRAVTNTKHGHLFPALHGDTVRPHRKTYRGTMTGSLRSSLKDIGLPADKYGMSSFRSGCIAWLDSQGVLTGKIMKHSGHARISSLVRYLRSSTSIETSPLNRTSWVD